MSFLDRIRSLGNRAGSIFRADSSTSTSGLSTGRGNYDAAQSSPARTSFLSFPLTARQEINPYDRKEILRKIRALEANLGLVARMKSQVGKYAVGFGVMPTPMTSDPDWNTAVRSLFMDWANNPGVCDVAGAMTFWERQRFHAETFFAEGESFDALVSSSVSGFPQLQLFDNSEVGGGYIQKPGYFDGVKVNAQNRPLAYLVATAAKDQPLYSPLADVTEIDAANMIHIIRRKRANQLRGISPFAPGINSAIDQLDLKSLVTAAAKLHEALGVVVKKAAGDAGKKGLTGQVNKLLDSEGNLTRVDEKFLRGAAIQYLKLDEEIEIVSSDRPTQNLIDWYINLVRDVCLTTGLNFEIVFSLMELGGAPARIVLADAQWFFDQIQDTLNDRFNQRIWVWFCASMMKNGQLARCADPRWWNCHWQGPPKLTADAGRTAQAEIDLLHAGFNSWQDFYNQRGRAWQPVIAQRIDELKWAKAACELAGVPLEYIFALKPGTNITATSDNSAD